MLELYYLVLEKKETDRERERVNKTFWAHVYKNSFLYLDFQNPKIWYPYLLDILYINLNVLLKLLSEPKFLITTLILSIPFIVLFSNSYIRLTDLLSSGS